jgi:DNA-binding transcriptional regulator YiaG
MTNRLFSGPSPLRNLPSARAIRHLRYGLGLGQPEFSEAIGCSVASLSDWENGRTIPGRMAQRALQDVARSRGWTLDLDKGLAGDPMLQLTSA